MDFHDLQASLKENWERLCDQYKIAFETDCDKDTLWETYLESFPKERNPIFKTRREYDCSCCRHFIKAVGHVVFVTGTYEMASIWDFTIDDPDYQAVIDAVSRYVKSRKITGYFMTKTQTIGTRQNLTIENGETIRYEHFFVNIPENMRVSERGAFLDTIYTKRGKMRDEANVFFRSMRDISQDAIDTVLELISTNTLYRGNEWERILIDFAAFKRAFDNLSEEKQILFAWKNALAAGTSISKIKNHSIGVLLTDVSEGVDLETAVRRYERIVAPANYKRPKAIFTAKMLEAAKQTIVDLGYMDSLPRRFAKMDDITVNNILFCDRDSAKRIAGSVFDEMLSDAKTSPKKFDRVEEVSIDRFVSSVLPSATKIEAYVENRHAGNFCSLIAPINKEAPSMFKWGNAFSWAYSGNIADSSIRENVKSAGGKVDGVLRFSIQWNDGQEHSANDLDAHCKEPGGGDHIFYAHKFSRMTGGELDVDIISPRMGKPAVENITWATKKKMIPGEYLFYVNQFVNRGGRDGFRAEIAFDGQTLFFDYPKELRQSENVDVATVTLSKDGKFSIKTHLPSTTTSKEVWGIKTMAFVPVTVVMYSPNYWDEQSGSGNKHYFFMLNGCVNPEKPNGFYNEHLKNDLLEHKRVFEALGGKMAVQDCGDQLSGLGFAETKRNDIVVRVTTNNIERIMRVKF